MKGVNGTYLMAVLSRVVEDVAEGVPDLSGGGEVARVVAVGPDAAGAAGGAVDAPGGADGEAAQARGESRLVVRLDDEVNVVALDGEVDDAEVGAGCGSDGGFEGAVETDAA
jgi:hypothetical protein